jgi:glycosyltransferase A (GT-A) superfamily protein (DUF2064 family)
LLFAPVEAEAKFKALLREHKAVHGWMLVPMSGGDNDTTSSDLGAKLKHGLERVREMALDHNDATSVVFVGSDCIDVEASLVVHLLQHCTDRKAAIVPAVDGGYVAMGLGGRVPSEIFDGVEWSTAGTCMSQIQSLSVRSRPCAHIPTCSCVSRIQMTQIILYPNCFSFCTLAPRSHESQSLGDFERHRRSRGPH